MFSKDALALLPGHSVVDRDGKRIGRILDVYAAQSDPTSFAAVSSRVPGRRSALVPLDGAELDRRTVRVPYSRDEVRAAPAVEIDGELSRADAERLLGHYGPVEPGADSAGATSALAVTVTVTATAGDTDGGTDTVVEAVAGAVRELVGRTTAELRADPQRASATATAQVDLDAAAHQRSTTPATGGSDNSVA